MVGRNSELPSESTGRTMSKLLKSDTTETSDKPPRKGNGGADVVHARIQHDMNNVSDSADVSTSQKQLSEYRERLARDLERRELAARGFFLGPQEQANSHTADHDSEHSSSNFLNAAFSPPSGMNTSSTESGRTVRGGITPAVANTPSYPFPRMNPTRGHAAQFHQAFTALSPTGALGDANTPYERPGAFDRLTSENSSHGSNVTFHPSEVHQYAQKNDFPTPNLYDLSLMLSAEPGLDAWWATVVQIMKSAYKAERVTLAIPADSTDIENVPWGQKATYNEHQEDALSMAYMGKGSSVVTGSEKDISEVATPADETSLPLRPQLPSRHSYTAYEDKKGQADPHAASRRPAYSARSRSVYPSTQNYPDHTNEHHQLNQSALEDLEAEGDPEYIPSWETPLRARRDDEGRVLPVLQALDYEADPLIDHLGVTRVLERGRPVALTRTYPYLAKEALKEACSATQPLPKRSSGSKREKKPRTESTSALSSIFPGPGKGRTPGKSKLQTADRSISYSSKFEDDDPQPPTPVYEEYEQAPPSPWSQSPAPSPAVRADSKENPFFTDAMVDEDSFNPGRSPEHYGSAKPPEAIGVDNSWTVLHIPLSHVLLSKPLDPFKLDSDSSDPRILRGLGDHKKGSSEDSEEKGKKKSAPIAIISILSPVIPYPSSLRRSLEHLAPHMATSFSLCRHYSNLETELQGLKRRRPSVTTGFGAVAPDGRPMENYTGLSTAELERQPSRGGSMTSPSEYSTLSKSNTASPLGTPGWEQGSLNSIVDKRAMPSPAYLSAAGEGYFGSKGRALPQRSQTNSKDNSPTERRQTRTSDNQSPRESSDARISHQATASQDAGTEAKREAGQDAAGANRDSFRGHSQLHSYGADFSSTFQSLPQSSTVTCGQQVVSVPTRTGSLTSMAVDMPPPSDRLKGLILDSLPAHVFVALPQNGEIVWVNSRFLSYRGQTVVDLAMDPWGNIHSDDRAEYLKAWGHSLRTGEQFSRTVRIRRFDGAYRWFYARAVASKDKRGVIMQFLGSYMDIHDQHIAELKAARQEEIEASEAKHKLLANLIPQIIFTATGEDGVTFANEQWLSYTGQSFDDSLGLGFMDFVHPEDLAKCRIPTDKPPTPLGSKLEKQKKGVHFTEGSKPTAQSMMHTSLVNSEPSLRGVHHALSRNNSSSSGSLYELPTADLTELASKGIIKVTTDTNGRLSYTTEVRLRSKSGEYRWHLIRCVEIDTIDFGSGMSSYFGSATDINDHKLLEGKLKEAMESKGRFLSNMSHEIRTPLIGISGMVSFLQDSVLNEEQRDYTNTIQTSANSLIMIINDILDLSKVDAGMMKLRYEWFHTRSLIEDVNELVSTMAIAKRLELNYLVEADVPAWVKGDKVRIRQVLLNVIGNAIKFTNEGEVFSSCRVVADDKGKSSSHEIMLEFAVTDTGRGFTTDEADLIFKPFSQIDGSSTRQHGGSGLGLVISRQLVELHGGKMEGTAIPGKGSTFTFSANFALPSPEDYPSLPSSPASTVSVPSKQDSTEHLPGDMKTVTLPPQIRNVEGLPPTSPDADKMEPSSSVDPAPAARAYLRPPKNDRRPVPTVNTGLSRFSEAAKASGQDLSQMKLEMVKGKHPPARLGGPYGILPEGFHHPVYSILIICPQHHSREATKAHIEMTLPKDVPHQLTALATVDEAQSLFVSDDPTKFTHVVINLQSLETILSFMSLVFNSRGNEKTQVLVLLDTVQRQAMTKMTNKAEHEKMLTDNTVTFIYKPVKPSRFAVIFDPDRVRDLSIDRNRSTAQQMVDSQKASYLEIEKLMGNKGYRVLLVEDNLVNQKVLTKYLKKIGVEVDVAGDGEDCTDMVLSKPHKHYSLILCDLHMPRKDGYQACREIRQWEQASKYPKMPIIALSANVMSDVQEKCVAAGFSDYVTKPVDFIDLSRAMAKFF